MPTNLGVRRICFVWYVFFSTSSARASARTRVVPHHLRTDPEMELPEGLKPWVSGCYTILSKLSTYDYNQHKNWGFGMYYRPVATVGWPGCETYLPVLERGNTFPVDLGEIRKRLRQGDFYATHHSFAADVRRVFHNALLFNEDPKR